MLPRGCSAELLGNRPKIYIANFYVTYGKTDIGKAIGDYVAEKFETDGRLEVISRSMINEENKPLLREKKGKRISFLVRMAAVETGQNLRKVDTEVGREAAMGFLEKVGDSFVTYFTTVTVPVTPTVEVALPHRKKSAFMSRVRR